MANRRLAPPEQQPKEFFFTAENQSWAENKMAEYPPGRQQSAVIPVLFRAQEQDGWVTRASIEYVAKLLGMAYIRVLEVATSSTRIFAMPRICATCSIAAFGSQPSCCSCARHNSGITADCWRPSG